MRFVQVAALAAATSCATALPEINNNVKKAPTTSSAALPTVTLDSGVIVGTTTTVPSATASVYHFLGVPFGVSPPTRFAPPEPVRSWSSPKNTTQRAPACMEQFMGDAQAVNITKTLFAYPDAVESEDCLYLNVFVPATATKNKTVMNWIFPGNLYFGDASRPQYDGSSFAANQDVIVVAGNYRTNAFGFSSSPAIPVTQQNAGFYDQRLVLDWISRNIEQFGGSPSKVLVFGESSGASSVDRLVTTNNLPGKFRAAIAQSGSASVSAFPNYYPDSWPTLVNLTNCTTGNPDTELACVRKVPAFTIKSLIETNSIIFPPANDNITQLPTPLLNRRLAKQTAQIPYLIGTNGAEGTAFMLSFLSEALTNPTGVMDDVIPYDLDNPTAAQTAAIKAAYPITITNTSTNTSNAYSVISRLFTDVYFTCPIALEAASQANAANPSAPVYRYFFNQSYPNLQLLEPTLGLDLGAYHTIEAGLVFGTYPTAGATPAEIAMSKFLQTTWADFAKNPALGPGWMNVLPGSGADGAKNATGGARELYLDVGEFVTFANGTPGVKLRKEQDLDANCGLFSPQYDTIDYSAF